MLKSEHSIWQNNNEYEMKNFKNKHHCKTTIATLLRLESKIIILVHLSVDGHQYIYTRHKIILDPLQTLLNFL